MERERERESAMRPYLGVLRSLNDSCLHRGLFAYDRGRGEKEKVAIEGGSDGWDRKANNDYFMVNDSNS